MTDSVRAQVAVAAAPSFGERAALFLLAGGGLGYLPKVPGTWGTAGAVGVFWGMHALFAEWLAAPGALLFFLATCALGQVAQRRSGREDPGFVVSDEFAGYLAGVSFTLETTGGAPFWPRALLGFVVFRVFDIAKPWPVRPLERLPGGLGIAADDVMAGLLTNAVLVLWFRALAPELARLGAG